MTDQILELTTTTENQEQADKLARELVEERLAACVQITGPMQSVYRWQGEICTASEYRITAKSTVELEQSIVRFLNEHHPYDTPEILLNHVRASPAYGQWLGQQVVDPSSYGDE